jgi:hypothetical protein
MTARSTRDGSNGTSSRRDTLFVGETSNSPTRVVVDGAYAWRDEGCEEGRIRVDVGECIARGTEENTGKSL